MTDLKALITEEIKALAGVEIGPVIDIGLLHPVHAKKWLVRKRYFELAKTGRTYTDIKFELSEKYQISVSSIEKMIYRKEKRV